MGVGTGIAIFFVIWWTTLFITLPFRMRPQFESGDVTPGTEEAAPRNPQMLRRMLWNTALSGSVFFAYWFIFYYLDFDLDDLPELVPIPVMEQ
jgi:predicted secreted protein